MGSLSGSSDARDAGALLGFVVSKFQNIGPLASRLLLALGGAVPWKRLYEGCNAILYSSTPHNTLVRGSPHLFLLVSFFIPSGSGMGYRSMSACVSVNTWAT